MQSSASHLQSAARRQQSAVLIWRCVKMKSKEKESKEYYSSMCPGTTACNVSVCELQTVTSGISIVAIVLFCVLNL